MSGTPVEISEPCRVTATGRVVATYEHVVKRFPPRTAASTIVTGFFGAMKALFWFMLVVSLTGLAFWFVISPWYPKNPVAVFLIAVFFDMAGVGGFWMLYVAIRYEEHPLLTIILAFVPHAFLWYYFERARPSKNATAVP